MMNLVLNSLNRLHKEESGQGLVEYLLILALVAFAATAGMNSLAHQHHPRHLHHIVAAGDEEDCFARGRAHLLYPSHEQTEPT